MIEGMMSVNCGTCRYGSYHSSADVLMCLRFPPKRSTGEKADAPPEGLERWEFPVVHSSDWCGEWKDKS
jgi:hypothetical protein